MDHLGTQPLQTGRLVLRRFTVDDAEVMFGNWASDPKVTRWLRWNPHRSWVETAEYLHEVTKQYGRPDFYDWAIQVRASGVVIGSISLIRAEPDPAWAAACRKLGEAWEPGYCIGRKWWSRGYATEALCAVRDYWFDQVGGQWLCCCHANDNVASGAVMEKAGFRYHHSGVSHRFDGTEVPCRFYALLKGMNP